MKAVKSLPGKSIRVVNNYVLFYSIYDESLISAFKEAKLKWDRDRRVWYADLHDFQSARDFLDKLSGVLSYFPQEEILYAAYFINSFYSKLSNVIELSRKEDSNFPVPVPEGLSLYPYQRAGVEFMVSKQNVLLADSMGLGKSIQVIGYLNYQSRQTGKIPQSLIICPSSVKYNWLKELNKWSINSLNIEVLEGKNGFEQNPEVNIYICNYDILQGKEFKNLDCIVLDEAHYIKNQQALRTKEVQRICKSNPQAKIIALTGTPMLNRPAELFPILNLLLPYKFDNFFEFAHKYCAAHKKQIHTREGIKEFWDFSGASNTEELGRFLRATIMLRREKSQVLKELPEKIRTVIPVKKKTGKVFLDLEERAKGMIGKIKEINQKIKEAKKNGDKDLLNKLKLEKTHVRSVAFTVMNEYRRYAFEEKKDIIIDFLNDTLESEPVIVFVHHRDVAKFFKDTFRHYNPLVITGETPAVERAKLVETFQTKDEYPLFIATILAAAEGITLTKASTVMFAEYEWTPAKMLQAEGRAHRIGQKNTVNSYWFALQGSVDEYFINKIIEKLQIEHEIMQDIEEEEIFMAVE